MEWQKIELRPLFDLLIDKSEDWEPHEVLKNIQHLSDILSPQLESFTGGKYRSDRNQALGYFEAISKFSKTGLPLSMDHFQSITNDYKDEITPYPHYSGIKVIVPQDLNDLDKVRPNDVPDDVGTDEDEEETDSSLKLL